jgi:hypothetical protein
MLMLVGMGNPLGTRNPHGYEFGQNFIPVMGMSFLADIFFLRGYEFGLVILSGFLPLPSLLMLQPSMCSPPLVNGFWAIVMPRWRAPTIPAHATMRPPHVPEPSTPLHSPCYVPLCSLILCCKRKEREKN